MGEARTEDRLRALSQMSEEDLHHAEDFLTTGHAILSGAFARHAARRALQAAAAARGKEVPPRVTMEALVKELEPPPEIAHACRELVVPSGKSDRPDRYLDLGRRVVRWATRAAEGHAAVGES